MSKICIYGAGAIGGFMAARLHEAGAEVSLIARGPHLEAIRKAGLRLIYDGRNLYIRCQQPTIQRKLGRKTILSLP